MPARKDTRMMETEFREESLAIAQKLEGAREKDRPHATQFALAWLWANQIVSSVIAGPRTLAQWQEYAGAIGTPWTRRTRRSSIRWCGPAIRRRPVTTIRNIRSSGEDSSEPRLGAAFGHAAARMKLQ